MLEIILITMFRLMFAAIGGYGIKMSCDAFQEGRFWFFGTCLMSVLIPTYYMIESFTW